MGNNAIHPTGRVMSLRNLSVFFKFFTFYKVITTLPVGDGKLHEIFMNVDYKGVLILWINLLWIAYWPIPFALLFTIFFGRSFQKKILFFIVAVIIGFAVNFIYEYAFLKFFIVDPKNPHIRLPASTLTK
jgi:hypothetical protein